MDQVSTSPEPEPEPEPENEPEPEPENEREPERGPGARTGIEVDVLVVGAGVAGSAASAFLAEAGLGVVCVDRLPLQEAGARWANAVPPWGFGDSGIALPRPPEQTRPAHGHGNWVADAQGDRLRRVAADPLLHVDMPSLVSRLQERARTAGAHLSQGRVVSAEPRGAALERVCVVEPGTSGGKTYRPALLVDASGHAGVLRRLSPVLREACPDPSARDLCLAAQGRFQVADPAGARAYLERLGLRPGEIVSRMGVSGGFSTLMVGVTEDLTEVALLAGTIPADGHPTGAALLDRFVREHPFVGSRLSGGQGPIPLGPPYTRITAPGIALVGDSAHQVFALHGSGVAMGLVAARTLADEVARGVGGGRSPGDPEVLHRYAFRFQRRFGGRLAAADVFRRAAQELSPRDVSELMTSGLMRGDMVERGLLQEPFSVAGGAPFASLRAGLGAALRSPRLAASLSVTVARLLLVQRAYAGYPERPDARELARFTRRVARLGALPLRHG